jgi:hypothetical protein
MITFILCLISYVTIGYVVATEAIRDSPHMSDSAFAALLLWPFVVGFCVGDWIEKKTAQINRHFGSIVARKR